MKLRTLISIMKNEYMFPEHSFVVEDKNGLFRDILKLRYDINQYISYAIIDFKNKSYYFAIDSDEEYTMTIDLSNDKELMELIGKDIFMKIIKTIMEEYI